MPEVEWEIVEYPGCLQSCVWGWRELYALAKRSGESELGGRVVLIPAYSGGGLPPTKDEAILERLRSAHRKGAVVASVCAGAAWIAAAGLDRGRALTTHWSLAPQLAALRADVRVVASCLVIDHGDIVSAGGLLSWIDLGLHLIERYWGKESADDCARTLVWDRSRKLQTPYAPPGSAWIPLRADPALNAAISWIGVHFPDETRISDWASAAALSPRSLQRRWTAAFGLSPIAWLQRARVEEARRRLEQSDAPWEVISRDCGYSDPSGFRCLFEREVGWTPGRYRKEYGRK
ncbi:MAG: helix-turn-helix domain-containing protein [Treponemataceae bacterium]